MNMNRRRRRWLAWERWLDRVIKLSTETVGPEGALRAHNQRAAWVRRKNTRT